MEGGGAPPADTVMSDAAPPPQPDPQQQQQQPVAAMGIENIPATLSHGGRFIQYNIFGNIFEVTAKYKPPIMPIGKGAYGIVWYVTYPFALSRFLNQINPQICFFMYSSILVSIFFKKWFFYWLGLEIGFFFVCFSFRCLWIARLWIRIRMSMSPLRRLPMRLTTRLMPRGPSAKSSCFATWIMKTLVSNDSFFFICFLFCANWINLLCCVICMFYPFRFEI